MIQLASFAVPVYVLAVLVAGIVRRRQLYSPFISGARQGVESAVKTLPYILAMLFAITVLRQSGLATVLGLWLDKLLVHIGVPEGMGMFLFIRPLSGSAALAELNGIFAQYGVDSRQGRLASILMSSTETVFYTIPVYLAGTGIKGDKRAIIVGLLSMLAGTVTAVLYINIV